MDAQCTQLGNEYNFCEACEESGAHDVKHDRMKIAIPKAAGSVPSTGAAIEVTVGFAPAAPAAPVATTFGMIHATSGKQGQFGQGSGSGSKFGFGGGTGAPFGASR